MQNNQIVRVCEKIVSMLVALIFAANAASAQGNPRGAEAEMARRVPVVVAVVDSFPYGQARAVIVRRTQGDERDVIVIPRENATGEQLSAAMVLLLAQRELDGDSAATNKLTRVSGATGPRNWIGRETKQNQAFIDRILTGPSRVVQGIGRAKTDRLYLLPHAFQGKVRRGS